MWGGLSWHDGLTKFHENTEMSLNILRDTTIRGTTFRGFGKWIGL
jgi:hypothetical protein